MRMSRPSSAMMTWAVCSLIPGISSSRAMVDSVFGAGYVGCGGVDLGTLVPHMTPRVPKCLRSLAPLFGDLGEIASPPASMADHQTHLRNGTLPAHYGVNCPTASIPRQQMITQGKRDIALFEIGGCR